MFLTQSAVSHSIKALETSLGSKLIDRGGRRIGLTAEGESLLRHAEVIIREMEEAAEDLNNLNQWGCGRVRLAATDTMCEHLLPPVIREFRESYPKGDVQIRAADTEEILAAISGGDVELGIGLDPGHEVPGIEFQPLFEDRLIFAVPPFHPWAETSTPIDFPDALSTERFIVYAKQSPTSRLVERSLRRLGLHSPRLTELGNVGAIRELAKIGMGVGVVAPWSIREDLLSGALVQIEPPGEMMVRRWVLFSAAHGSGLTMTGEGFAGICRKGARSFECASLEDVAATEDAG